MEYWNNHKIMQFFFSCLLIFSVNLCIAGINEVLAKEYFVAASNGKDGNSGTKGAPFLTLEKGVSVLFPGDILYVRGGTYQRNHNLWNPPNGTSWANPVTIKAYQNEKVIVKPLPRTGVIGNSVFYFVDNRQYIIMEGLTVDGTGGAFGYRMGNGGHHIRFSNGEVKNTHDSAIQDSKNQYNEYINLKLHDAWQGVYVQPGASSAHMKSYGIYLNGDKNLVQGCEIYNNYGYGIHVYSATGSPSYNTLINNKIHDNAWAGLGIFGGDRNIIINNIAWNNDRGIHVDLDATNTVVYHNTFYSNKKTEILLGPRSNVSFVKNNLLVGTSSFPVFLVSPGSGAAEIENNLIVGKSADPNSLLQISDTSATVDNFIGPLYNPGLKDPAHFDFHLTESSSAIRAGQILVNVTNDMDNVPRNPNAGYDIGAYQYNGVLLEPPTSLRILHQ